MKAIMYIVAAICALEVSCIHTMSGWKSLMRMRIDIISEAEAEFLKKHPQSWLSIHTDSPDKYISAVDDTGYSKREIQVRLIQDACSSVALKIFVDAGFGKDQNGFVHRRIIPFEFNVQSQELYGAIKNTLAAHPNNFTTVINSLYPLAWRDSLYNLIVQISLEKLEEQKRKEQEEENIRRRRRCDRQYIGEGKYDSYIPE